MREVYLQKSVITIMNQQAITLPDFVLCVWLIYLQIMQGIKYWMLLNYMPAVLTVKTQLDIAKQIKFAKATRTLLRHAIKAIAKLAGE